MTINDRIKAVREAAGISQTAFSTNLGIGPSAVAKLESGVNSPSEQTVKLICREFNIHYLWLTEGVEPMYVPEESSVVSRLHNVMHGDHEFAKRVLREFSTMPREAWLELEAFIDRLAEKK